MSKRPVQTRTLDRPSSALFPGHSRYHAREVVSHKSSMKYAARNLRHASPSTERPTNGRRAVWAWLAGCRASGQLLAPVVDGRRTGAPACWPEWVPISVLADEATCATGRYISISLMTKCITDAMPGIEKKIETYTRRIGKKSTVKKKRTVYRTGPWLLRTLTPL